MDIVEFCFKKYKTTKLHHPAYVNAYQQMLGSTRLEVHKVLEMGIGDGSSLRAWRDIFPFANITGLDTDETCTKHVDDRIDVIIGNQSDISLLQTISKNAGPFDIIIDDAGHDNKKQQIALFTLFPLLVPGGCYVIEDLESSFWEHQGGYKGPDTTVEVLKNALDGINIRHILNNVKRDPLELVILSNLASAHWYENVCFLFKSR